MDKVIAHLKGALKSWTIWFNAVAGAVVADLSSPSPLLLSTFPQLQGYIPDTWHHYAMGLLIAGNFLLRFKTNSSLAGKAAPKGE